MTALALSVAFVSSSCTSAALCDATINVANAAVTARKDDNPADVATPAASNNEKEEAMMAAFDKALGGN